MHKQKKNNIAFAENIWKAFIKKTQGVYKMQGVSTNEKFIHVMYIVYIVM